MVPWGPPSSVVSVTRREPRSGHRKWKIPEIDRSRRKSCTVASSVLESDVIALCPAGRMNHVCRVYSHCVHRLVAWWAAQWLGHLSKHRGACVRVTLFYLIMAPKHMSSDAGSSNMPERSRKVLPFRGKSVCVCVCGERIWYYPWPQATRGGHGPRLPRITGNWHMTIKHRQPVKGRSSSPCRRGAL